MSPFLFVNHSSSTIAPSVSSKSHHSKRPSSAVVSYVQRGVQRKRRAESLKKLKAARRPPWFAPSSTNDHGEEKVWADREGGGRREEDKGRKNVWWTVSDTEGGRREVDRSSDEEEWRDEGPGVEITDISGKDRRKTLKWQPPKSVALISSPKAKSDALESPTLSVNSSDLSTTSLSSESLVQPYGTHALVSFPHPYSYSSLSAATASYAASQTSLPGAYSNNGYPSPRFHHGSSDPFTSTSRPLTPSTTRLLSYLIHTLPTYWILRDSSRFSLTQSDISAALHAVDPTQMDALLAMASALVATHSRLVGFGNANAEEGEGKDRHRQQHKTTLLYTGRGVEGLRRSLSSSPPSSSSSSSSLLSLTLTTILFLSRAAGYDADDTTATLHMHALRRLVAANGGLAATMHPLRAECVVAFDVKLAGLGAEMRRSVWDVREWEGEWGLEVEGGGGGYGYGYGYGYWGLDDERRGRGEFELEREDQDLDLDLDMDRKQERVVPSSLSLGRRFFENDENGEKRFEEGLQDIVRSLLDVVHVYDYISAHPSAVSRADPVHRWLHLRPVACEARLLDYYCSLPPLSSTSTFPSVDDELSTQTQIQIRVKRLAATSLILWLNLSLDNPILPNIRRRLCSHLRRAMSPLLHLASTDHFIGELLLFSAFLGAMCEANVANPLRPSIMPFFERDDEVEEGWWRVLFARVRMALGLGLDGKGYGEVKRVLEGFLFLERLGGEVLRGLVVRGDEEEVEETWKDGNWEAEDE